MPSSSGRKGTRPARISRRDAIVAVAFIAALVGGMIALARRPTEAAVDAGQIYGGLPPDAAQADVAFRARVAAEFPLLTPEDALVRSLSNQGFRQASPRRMVYRRWVVRHSPTCGFDASVAWQADDQGRVTALEGHYLRALGCVEQAR